MLKNSANFSKFCYTFSATGKFNMYKCNGVTILRNLIIYTLFLLPTFIPAQSIKFEKEIGDFSGGADFSISPNEFIYVTDTERNEIYKLDFEGNVLNFIGGYGWNPATFDEPVHIFASTLSVYVTDKNNDRIQYFDKDLNYLSQLRSDDLRGDYSFRYPTAAVVSPVGDLFVLDSDNSRILKFDLNGNFTTEIGSYDAGSFALENPIKFDISSDSRLFVLDQNKIKVFDQFGGGLNFIHIDQGAVNINIQLDMLNVVYKNKIILLDLKNPTKRFQEFMLAELYDIKDAIVYNDRLFVLTPSEILIYNFVRN